MAPRLLALVRYNWAKASGLVLLHSMLARCTLPITKHRIGYELMGLDIVEFVMDVEERFGIEIPDKDAQNLTTPRLLVDYILNKVKPGEDRGCLSQREFYRLRRALIGRRWTTRKKLKPETSLEQIVPKSNRRTAWEQLGEEIEHPDLPNLTRPKYIKVALVVIGTMAFLLPWLKGVEQIAHDNPRPVWVSVLSAILVVWVGMVTTRPLKLAVPYDSVEDFVRYLLAHPRPEKSEEGWTRQQVRETIHAMIVEHFAVTEFTDDSRFVQDMHVD